MVPSLKKLSYEERLKSLGLWSLEERRHRADLEVFRMYKEWSKIRFDSTFKLNTGAATRGHTAKILKSHCTLDLRSNFFSERVINRWISKLLTQQL